MKLERYDITVIVSDPNDAETKAEAVIRGAKREDILRKGSLFQFALETLEASVD